jgi:hypothetical protein
MDDEEGRVDNRPATIGLEKPKEGEGQTLSIEIESDSYLTVEW